MDDHELLRDYVERQSDAAFAELVARHVNLVYGTARRVVGDSAAAQDVVQNVFIHLARKAWTVRDGRALSGWLYRAAYRTALDVVRGDQRRRQRETEAMNLAEQNADEATWEKLAPLLDEAMQHLNRAEQDAVVCRFFEGLTMRETGTALGTTEAAAQMRVSRALEKMRAHFARGGVTVATGALALALSARPSEAAPAGLAARVTGPSLAEAGSPGIGAILLRILFMSTKTKIITALAVTIILVLSLTLILRSQGKADVSVPGVTSPTIAMVAKPVVAPVVPTFQAPMTANAESATTVPPLAVPAATSGVVPAPVEPRKELNTTLAEAIRLLKAKDYMTLLVEFTPPEMTSSGSYNFLPLMDASGHTITKEQIEAMQQQSPDLARQWAQMAVAQSPDLSQMVDDMLTGLESAQDLTPTLDGNGNIATYIANTLHGKYTAIFVKRDDGLWYLRTFGNGVAAVSGNNIIVAPNGN